MSRLHSIIGNLPWYSSPSQWEYSCVIPLPWHAKICDCDMHEPVAVILETLFQVPGLAKVSGTIETRQL